MFAWIYQPDSKSGAETSVQLHHNLVLVVVRVMVLLVRVTVALCLQAKDAAALASMTSKVLLILNVSFSVKW